MSRKLVQGSYLVQGRIEAFCCMDDHLRLLKIDPTCKAKALRAWSFKAGDIPTKGSCIITLVDKTTSGLEDSMIITEVD